MRNTYLILILLFVSLSVSAASFRGFLLTKDGYQLTGYLNLIEYAPTGNLIVFTNDFGDEYSIHPTLVKGFGFSKDGENFRYVSRFHEGLWFFLREDQSGRALRLYRLPDSSDDWVDDQLLQLFQNPIPTYWIGYGKDQIFPVPRVGYKKSLREFFAEASPELARKIGKRGYRYRDIYAIVAEFNERSMRRRRRL
ncbi:hypothetical protein [Lewinella sp. W8]|uniref:hypothetical protein n=1 Tax=Lewinella sp. W8 TaxID=2528208 RepID=UPI001067DE21|nr:hypothetical protein [Lewinella sp. W8]MTB49790.1 hypothetical protein [Lewinella sp. W8]